MKPKISIIIPVYNVEQYLRRSLDSILKQTIKDIEVILIDDGSQDDSGRICDEYAVRDSRFKVIHQENAGASEARNKGLAIASGDYIGFVDADDCISPLMFELLYDRTQKTNAELIICDYSAIDGNLISYDPKVSLNDSTYYTIDKKEAFRLVTDLKKNIGAMVWNKLFKTDIIQGLFFDPQMRVCHDVDFLMKALSKTEKAVYIPYPLYGYFLQRPGSLTSHKNHDNDLRWNIESYHRDISKAMDDFIQENPDLKDHAAAYKCFGDMVLAKTMIDSGKIDKGTNDLIREGIKKNVGSILRSDFMLYMKIQMLVFLVNPGLFKLIYTKFRRKKEL